MTLASMMRVASSKAKAIGMAKPSSEKKKREGKGERSA